MIILVFFSLIRFFLVVPVKDEQDTAIDENEKCIRMFAELFLRILITGEGLLWRIKHTNVRTIARDRVQCQRSLSRFCGIWNQHRRQWPILVIDPKYRSETLSEYAGIGVLMSRIQEYSFQNPSKKAQLHVEGTIHKIVNLIHQGKVIKQYGIWSHDR